MVLELKDYYSILEIEPSATGDEIKKAYRRLAHLYHPDKHAQYVYASAKFSEIKEAYEILSNPVKKDYYLQQRWFAQSIGRPVTSELVTPVTILKKMLALDRYVSKLDVHRTHHDSLYNYICNLLSDETIQTVNGFGELHVNAEIIRATLKSAQGLPFRFIHPVAARLRGLTVNDEAVIKNIDRFVIDHKKADDWEKKKVWVIALIVLLICVSIFFSTR